MIDAVIFDLDGVLIDSEQLWDESRRAVARLHGGRFDDDATPAMQGMSSPEWSHFMRNELGVELAEQGIVDAVVSDLLGRYRVELPVVPEATESLRLLAERWPLALASSSNRRVIEEVLDTAGWRPLFQVSVSSEEVATGKPAPDVYFEAARRLRLPPRSCVAVEDSANGIRSAIAAGLPVIAVPNHAYPPPDRLLDAADVVVNALAELTVDVIDALDRRLAAQMDRRIDEQEEESFPASDPHSDWAGPVS